MTRRTPLVSAAATAGLGIVLLAHLGAKPRLIASPASTSGGGSGHASSHTGSSSSTSSGSSVSGTATGALEQYGYGELAVKLTVQQGRIVSATVVGLRTAETYSQEIAVQVIPMLRKEVLAAQSANISGISGATYTCSAYATSVQSALDKLHLK
ncbi:MAG TPA: FMN-binding protein [Acidimicrobiales bacterium]|nr:FMN-binding protein [Acidimicrobiales bacterium]